MCITIETTDGDDPIEKLKKENGLHYEGDTEIIVLDPYEWELTDWQITIYRFK
ncbi:hypothetical protein [Cellulophaga baltica]|uniref:Uncharacterized protein n=1 Tax=Cellulophaga baltica TaxID=76594 RepID=A0A1G7HJE4_9FLAO|nr:hypothetical protein [Cellulophaga baltica]SDF00456.1 hypothetical protein SAMN04487992_106110 [Cellulophaga baltica]